MTPNAALKPASPLHSPEALERQTALAPDFPQAVLGTDGAPLGFNRAPVRIAPDETGLAALDLYAPESAQAEFFRTPFGAAPRRPLYVGRA